MAAPQAGALAPDRVLDIAARAFRGDDQTQAILGNAYEAVALIGHACMVAVDFRLIGLGEEHRMSLYYDSIERLHQS
jgi:hypothetical protein